jgi:hypothetical protein
MSGTRFPTRDNWLLCHGCSRYFTEADIAAEDQSHQWCIECHRDHAARASAWDGAEGYEQ